MILLLIALGGAAGAVARYLVSGRIQSRVGHAFPWGTLTVNVSGSFVLGLVLPVLAAEPAMTPMRAFLTVGVLSAFTTFSSFAYETALLLDHGRRRMAATYVATSIGAGLAAVAGGFMLGSAIGAG